MVFFCKGVVETVKKFGWPPDIIHCHGWMTSLVPFFLRTVYANEPIFENSTVIYSAYNNSYEETFTEKFFEIAAINHLEKEDLADFNVDGQPKLLLGGMKYSDAIVKGTDELPEDVMKVLSENDKPLLEAFPEEEINDQMMEFYKGLLEPVS